MNLRHTAMVATVLVLIVGFAMIAPLFLRADKMQPKQKILLSFNIKESDNTVEWCQNLSKILNSQGIGAVVFFVGKVAQQNPQAVTCFADKVDIGSQTYNDVNLTAIDDYSVKLQEVEQGKFAVDTAGHLNSSVFQASFGDADQDIYSLLSRSAISVDISYADHYNVYQNGQFIKFNIDIYKPISNSLPSNLTDSQSSEPKIIEFDNTWTTTNINSFLGKLATGNFEFINASDLVGFNLTIRG